MKRMLDGISPAIVTISALVLCCASPSDAAEYPTRQHRRWQTSDENPPELSAGNRRRHEQQHCNSREATHPDAHQRRHSSHVSHTGRRALRASEALAAFDCCGLNHTSYALPSNSYVSQLAEARSDSTFSSQLKGKPFSKKDKGESMDPRSTRTKATLRLRRTRVSVSLDRPVRRATAGMADRTVPLGLCALSFLQFQVLVSTRHHPIPASIPGSTLAGIQSWFVRRHHLVTPKSRCASGRLDNKVPTRFPLRP